MDFRIGLISNTNTDSISRKLSKQYSTYVPAGFGNWLNDLINSNSDLYKFSLNACFILIDGDELLGDNKSNEYAINILEENIQYIYSALIEHKEIPFFISDLDISEEIILNFENNFFEKEIEVYWIKRLYEISKVLENLYIFNLKRLVDSIGKKQFYSSKLWYLGGIKYSNSAEKLIVNEIDIITRSMLGNKKKCLVLDLDNTLWGGIIGEDGVVGISLSQYQEGARYKDFQREIKKIQSKGVILCICSKNNEQDALEVFNEHPHMILKKSDFVILKINWQTKLQNIIEISKELNIGLDSIVFIDDSVVERESVRIELPEVSVPEFPLDSCLLADFAKDIYTKYFYTIKMTSEDKNKTQSYISNIKRDELKKQTKSYDDFMNSLEMKICVWEMSQKDITRVVQLIQKTNQFNLTTIRYSEKEILNFSSSNRYNIYCISVEDKFGDNGMVGVCIIKRDIEESIAYIDTFLLSCRVMSRTVEDAFINYAEQSLKSDGIKKIIALYIPTAKNEPVKELYEKLGYEMIKETPDGTKEYELNIGSGIFTSREFYGELVKK